MVFIEKNLNKCHGMIDSIIVTPYTRPGGKEFGCEEIVEILGVILNEELEYHYK